MSSSKVLNSLRTGIKQIILQGEIDLKYKYKKELVQGNGFLPQWVSKNIVYSFGKLDGLTLRKVTEM